MRWRLQFAEFDFEVNYKTKKAYEQAVRPLNINSLKAPHLSLMRSRSQTDLSLLN